MSVNGQLGYLDPTFRPVPTLAPDPSVGVKGQLVQPDGKILIWSSTVSGNGSALGQVARLNSDGSPDGSFSYCSCHLTNLRNLVLQADGKIIISGSDNTSKARVVRLNSDGSTDSSYTTTFPPPGTPSANTSSYVWLVQGDGKAYVQYDDNTNFGIKRLYRLNLDGGIDSSFAPPDLGSNRTTVFDVVLHGGQLYSIATSVFISSSNVTFQRTNLDGSPDPSWQAPSLAGPNGSFFVALYDIEFAPDGSLLMSGSFGSINGFQKSNLARILPAGNVDLNFNPPAVAEGRYVKSLSNGKILWSARPVSGPVMFYRLNTDGTNDPTFVDQLANVGSNSRWALDSSERIYYFGTDSKYHRLNPNGDVDTTFTPVSTAEFGKVSAAVRTPDGKIVIAGVFVQVNDQPRASVARLRGDGSVDLSFNAGAGFDQPPTQLRAQPDGKILAIGPFNTYNGASRAGIARINPDGTLDSGFNPVVPNVRTIAVQSDGKILIGGSFASVNGTPKAYLARLLSNGTLDSSFTTVVGCCDVNDLLIQPDGKILIGGGFSGVDGFTRPNLARLSSEGVLDQTFNAPPSGTSNVVMKVAMQPSGKYLTAISNSEIRRRNTDGSLDGSFTTVVVSTSDQRIDALYVDIDGSFIVGGSFTTPGATNRQNLARFSADGIIDTQFLPGGADGRVRTIIRDVAGRIIIAGDFARVNNTVRPGVARIVLRRPATFDFDGDGRSDVSVLRPSTNRWYELMSSTGVPYEETFGLAGDILAPADFDGDGVTDEAIFRPSSGQWWYRSSFTGALIATPFGENGDVPRPSDFDGDGITDLVAFRPSNNRWYRYGSSAGAVPDVGFGLSGDQPLVGDFDGDGKSDLAIFRPSSGDWWYSATSAGGAYRTAHWGQNGDIPVPADYDGDGKTDFAIFRPSDGGWYIYNSSNGSFTILAFGTNGDRPVAADYDGDGRADIAVFRPSTGIWYLYQTTSGFAGLQFGISTDTAIPGSLIP